MKLINSIIIKRIVIILILGMSLVVLEISSESSLFIALPSQEDIENSIRELEEQQEEINKIIEDELDRDPDEEYDLLWNNAIRHTFIIEFTSSEFQGVIDDMLEYQVKYGTLKSNNYRNVTVTYMADDDIQVFEDVGFRTKGHIYSRRLPVDEIGNVREVHFMLKFNDTFDLEEDTEEYAKLKKREAMGMEQILFKWNNVNDPANMNEVFSYQMFNEVDVIVPNASFAEVQIVIDGKVELVAFYNIFEHFDEEFIRRHFQDEPTKEVGDLYKGQWSGTLDPIHDTELYGIRDTEHNIRPIYSKETNKEEYTYDTLVKFSYGINDSDINIRKTFLEANFDTDNFMRAMAMNVLLGNPDDYRGNGNNFYYYFDRDGYMTYIPFDYDNSIGSGWGGEPAFINYTLGNDIYEWGHFDWNSFGIPLWDNLIEHEEYQIMYEDYLMQFINDGTFSVESYRYMYDVTKYLYSDIFDFTYNKEYFINTKIELVTEQVEYYRNQRN